MEPSVTTEHSSVLLSVKDIAAWQIPTVQPDSRDIRAALPALQRGAVWRAPQVEALWDSVMRGFPIGALLLAPFRVDKGEKRFMYAAKEGDGPPATHHMLDGQQRSNAFALGFLDPWRAAGLASPPAVLWLDLQPPAPTDEREAVFRMLTRSHPWGYRYNSLAGEGPRLPAESIRHAVAAYAGATPALRGKVTGEIPLNSVWPWDAHAPVPFCVLLDAAQAGGDLTRHIRRRLEELPFWRGDLANLHGKDWPVRVLEILEARSGSAREYLERIVEGVRRILAGSYRVPALVLPELTLALSGPVPSSEQSPAEGAERQDPVETLFIRVNAGGTPLVGEELVYSILKSIWPEAEQCIDGMNTRLAQPSRLVVLASRLVLAAENAFQDRPPAAPDVPRFRRLVNGVDRDSRDFRQKLLRFFQSGEAGRVFAAARDLLTTNRWCKLPPVLAADMARRSPNVMFLLLRWVQRLSREHDPAQLGEKATRRPLGAATALSWFSEDDAHCLTALWPSVQQASSRDLPYVLSQSFPRCFELTKGKLGMIPLAPPRVLEDALNNNLLERWGFNTPTSHLWQTWTWESLVGIPTSNKHLGNKVHNFYRRSFGKMWTPRSEEEAEAGEVDLDGMYQQAWTRLMDKLWNEKRLLLFAQRKWLNEWFSSYDPTSPDQIDESDRPWDFDHIHPTTHLARRKNVPSMIRDWHGSIGNLRAWPLQANRGDGDKPPHEKLTKVEALEPFEIRTAKQLLDASFVEDGEELQCWKGSTPEEEPFFAGYLGNGNDYGRCRVQLVRAIISRLLRIYSHWYDTLLIEDLYG